VKPNVSLKSLVRRPVRALLLFLLTGLISFAAVSQVTEYLLIREKTDVLGSYYHTIGTLQTTSKDGNVFKGAELVSQSPYVALEDRRGYCSGVLQDGLYNADTDGYSSDTDEEDNRKDHKHALGIHVSDVITYANLLSKSHMTKQPGNENSVEEYFLTFRVNKVVAGYPEYVQSGKTIKLSYVPKKDGEVDKEFNSLREGNQYLIRAYIVGLYGFVSQDYGSTLYTNYFYIPNSCLPVEYDNTKNYIYFPIYDFVLKSHLDKDAFFSENRARLAAMGITVNFIDNGSANYWAFADSLKFSALVSAGIFCVVALLALGLAVFLYLRPRRKEFAIQRALGLPRSAAAFRMAWPFTLLGAVGISLGGAFAWRYAFRAERRFLHVWGR